MLPGNLPRPLLSLLFEPVAKIQDSDEEALGGLWSIFTKVSDAISDGKRLENMSWRLWHRAYSRKAIAMIHSTGSGGGSDLRIRGASLLSPSLSFSSSSEATSNSSDWDRDTAVGDDEEALPNRNNNNGGGQPSSAVSPCLKNGRLTSNNLLTVHPTIACPALSTATSPSSSLSKRVDNANVDDGREMPTPLPLDLSPHLVQDADAGVRSDNPQTQGSSLPVSYQGPIDLSQNNADHVSCNSIRSPSPQRARFCPVEPTILTELLPVAVAKAASPESSTVGKVISRMFAEKIVFAKPIGQYKPNNDNVITLERKKSTPSPTVHILAPPDSPPSNANSTLTSAASTPRQSFPTVVVVNPTPHPTPPATPSIEGPEKTFVLPPNAVTAVLPPRLALDANIAGTSLSPSGNNTQLATPVSLGKHSVSLNDHVTPEQNLSQRPSSFVVPNSVIFTAPPSTTLSSKLSLASNSIALPDRPTSSMEIASHLPTPAAELTPDMTNGTSRATTAPIQAPVPVISEDKKFFLAVPHSGSGGSGHDSTESPDSFGTGSTNSRRRDTARGSPLIDLRDSYSRSQASSRPEEELSSSFSASSPAGRPPSITSSRGIGGGLKLKNRATFTVSGSSGKRKGSSKKSVKDLYKRQTEKRLSSAEHASVDESCLKGKGKAGSIERNEGTPPMPPAPLRTSNVAAQVPRVKTLHHLSGLNQNLQNQLNLRQLPTNPPRRPASPPPPNDKRGHVVNGATTRVPHTSQQLQGNSQHVGQLGIGHLPPVPPKSGRPIEIAETSSDYSTTDTEDDSWESESGSVDDKENLSNGQASRSRRSDVSKGERLRHSNRQRDPGESVRDAALEAQRQREMFQKLPSKTYSSSSQLPRTKSGLSLLFRPDPELFPVGHPYRTSRSSQDLLARNWSVPAPPLAMTAIQRSTPVAPVKADVTASSVTSKGMDETATAGPTRRSSATQAQPNGGKYRPRAKPADQEEESDSDDPEDIPIPHSVAERRLEALMKRGSRSQVHHTPSTPQKHQESLNTNTESHIQADNPQAIPRTTTMPVLPHQFLPEPAPLQLPHEIRRWIISRELDEELRRNLLWERSQNQIPGRPPRLNGSILTGPWKSLTPNKPTNSDEPQSSQRTTESKARAQTQNNEDSSTSRLFSTQRTKSWAGEYHATGW